MFYNTNIAARSAKAKSKKASVSYSLISLFLCMACFIAPTWAWFTSNGAVGVNSIQTADKYIDTIEVHEVLPLSAQEQQAGASPAADGGRLTVQPAITPDREYTFEVRANTLYLVKINIAGTSSTGFTKVETCDGVFYSAAGSFGFQIVTSAPCTVKISASWGTETGDAVEFADGGRIGSGTVAVCSCDALCADGAVDTQCPVCSSNYGACRGEEKTDECLCTAECGEEVNNECPVCAQDAANCAIRSQEVTDESSEASETTAETNASETAEPAGTTTEPAGTTTQPAGTTESAVDDGAEM